jgi:hypothetical protein
MSATAAMMAFDPEMTLPAMAAAHPRASLGAILIACSVVLAIVSVAAFALGFSRTIGRFVLLVSALAGIAGAHLTVRRKSA